MRAISLFSCGLVPLYECLQPRWQKRRADKEAQQPTNRSVGGLPDMYSSATGEQALPHQVAVTFAVSPPSACQGANQVPQTSLPPALMPHRMAAIAPEAAVSPAT